ncbi:L-selectin-like [Penaeus japonicus]|uniref:L-selectin-like n=1 Tax=Penaeus japonicus TaxID=27405 RepID=UPI001C711AC0|nr:L-selectin-like [Penaeus japonicus]XP_042885626.1 L-selectin-like [Penaeus japonicus]
MPLRRPLLRPLLLLAAVLPCLASNKCTAPFRSYGTEGCLQVVVASRPLTWHSARRECQAQGSDLAVLDQTEKFTALSNGIDKEDPDMTKNGYTFWVGAQRVNSIWRWTNDEPVEPNAELWVGGQPSPGRSANAAIMIPAGGAGGRRYLTNFSPDTFAPAFVCEKF